MSENKLARTVIVTNPDGLHMRPLDLLAKLANRFQARIELVNGRRRVDGKSILDLLSLGAVQGSELSIEATGPDAPAALDALVNLFATGFPLENGNAKH